MVQDFIQFKYLTVTRPPPPPGLIPHTAAPRPHTAHRLPPASYCPPPPPGLIPPIAAPGLIPPIAAPGLIPSTSRPLPPLASYRPPPARRRPWPHTAHLPASPPTSWPHTAHLSPIVPHVCCSLFAQLEILSSGGKQVERRGLQLPYSSQ